MAFVTPWSTAIGPVGWTAWRPTWVQTERLTLSRPTEEISCNAVNTRSAKMELQ